MQGINFEDFMREMGEGARACGAEHLSGAMCFKVIGHAIMGETQQAQRHTGLHPADHLPIHWEE